MAEIMLVGPLRGDGSAFHVHGPRCPDLAGAQYRGATAYKRYEDGLEQLAAAFYGAAWQSRVGEFRVFGCVSWRRRDSPGAPRARRRAGLLERPRADVTEDQAAGQQSPGADHDQDQAETGAAGVQAPQFSHADAGADVPPLPGAAAEPAGSSTDSDGVPVTDPAPKPPADSPGASGAAAPASRAPAKKTAGSAAASKAAPSAGRGDTAPRSGETDRAVENGARRSRVVDGIWTLDYRNGVVEARGTDDSVLARMEKHSPTHDESDFTGWKVLSADGSEERGPFANKVLAVDELKSWARSLLPGAAAQPAAPAAVAPEQADPAEQAAPAGASDTAETVEAAEQATADGVETVAAEDSVAGQAGV